MVAVTATANVIKKARKCNVRCQSFGSPPDHCLTRFGGPTGFLVDSGHRSILISSPDTHVHTLFVSFQVKPLHSMRMGRADQSGKSSETTHDVVILIKEGALIGLC